MTNKFNWVKTLVEYNALMTYLDAEIDALKQIKHTKVTVTIYAKFINDRDELFSHAIKLNLNKDSV